jgi:hypothetical protein
MAIGVDISGTAIFSNWDNHISMSLGASNGSLMIAVVTTRTAAGVDVSSVAPSGWNLMPYQPLKVIFDDWGKYQHVYYKFKTSADTTVDFKQTETWSITCLIASYSGVNTSNPFNAIGYSLYQNWGYSLPNAPINISSTNDWVVSIMTSRYQGDNMASQSAGVPTGYTARSWYNGKDAYNLWLADSNGIVSPGTITVPNWNYDTSAATEGVVYTFGLNSTDSVVPPNIFFKLWPIDGSANFFGVWQKG